MHGLAKPPEILIPRLWFVMVLLSNRPKKLLLMLIATPLEVSITLLTISITPDTLKTEPDVELFCTDALFPKIKD